ncbi:PRA1 family protein 2 [Eupeodes corollae]|uniref:PRA1 family protein 2 n=1 Tax=Eupeodes corollae TaxID=290404 RepID=UPI0024931D32|nr:PRA1 family protein 2 [Eupeodes corollae]
MTSRSSGAHISAENLQLPPLRSLDDFVLGSARFQLPNLQDMDKWGNRVYKNLLYYQTNYFLLFIAIYTLMAILNPVKIICGLVVQALLIAVAVYYFGELPNKKKKPAPESLERWYYLAGTLVLGYILLYCLNAVLWSLFTLLLPFSLSFVHASLRLRNLRNKVANTIENFGPATPMGVFLNTMNITGETILS